FDVPPEVGYRRIVEGRPTLKWYEAGLDMGWTLDPFESYRILQGKIKNIYDTLVQQERIVRVDALGSVSAVQERVRSAFSHHVDLTSIEAIDETDRVAETLRLSTLDWRQFESNEGDA
ncbi:MAG: hypothetical protein VYE08_02900, partial [Candidatus Thermoplasmatota archaeon]|nr:hypothetical protein [Candidatus Thermoplasmatota archaeon]